MRPRLQALVATLALGAACATASRLPEARSRPSAHWPEATGEPYFALRYQGATLDNGVRVVVLPDPTTALVQIDVRVDAGGRDAPVGRAGLAHLAEHLVFEVRPGRGPTIGERLQAVTISNNAYTNSDSTHYQDLALPDAVDAVVAIEAARFGAGCAGLDEATFARERDVVQNELRERGIREGGPERALMGQFYGKDHPYLRTAAGTEAEVASATLDEVCAFIAAEYAPSRLIVAIAGRVDAPATLALVKTHFGALPARAVAEHPPPPAAEPQQGRWIVTRDVEHRLLLWGLALPAREAKGGIEAALVLPVVRDAIGDAFRDDPRVITTAVLRSGGHHAPVLVVGLELADGADLDEVEEALEKAVHGVAHEPQLGNALRATMALLFSLEDLGARTSLVADHLQFAGNVTVGEDLAYLRRHGLGSFSFVLADFDRRSAVRLVVKPRGKPGGARAGARPTLGAPPVESPHTPGADPAEADRPLVMPAVPERPAARRFTLDNGLEVVLQAMPSLLPLATTRLVFRAGAAQEPAGRGGVAELAAAAFAYGLFWPAPGYLPEDARPAAILDEPGLRNDLDVGDDHTAFVAHHFDGLTPDVLHDLASRLNGYFDPRPLELFVDALEKVFGEAGDEDTSAIGYALDAALFGPTHPYARHIGLTRRSLLRTQVADVTTFMRRHYVARNAILVVVGPFADADLDPLEAGIRDEFGRWAPGEATPPTSEPARTRTAAIHVAIDTGDEGDASQLEIAIAWPAPGGVDAQHGARLVLAEVLQRRVAIAREVLGASYGLHARHVVRVGQGAYVVRGSVAHERAGVTLAALRTGLAALSDPADARFASDFAVARRTVFGRLLGFGSAASTVAYAWEYTLRFGLPDHYYTWLAGRVARLAPTEVQDLAARELLPEREIVIVAGPKKLVEKAFADASLPAPRFMKRWPRPTAD